MEEKKDGKQDGGQMKITVSREELKQIIKEEWEREMLLEMHGTEAANSLLGSDDAEGLGFENPPSDMPQGYDATVEGQDQELDYEGYMTKSQLFKIGEYALKLHDMIQDGENLPEWMQSKVSQMEKDVGSVFHALKYDKVRGTV
jgi:hypothetical protein